MRASTVFPARASLFRKCTVIVSPSWHSMTGPGIVPIVPLSEGSGSLRSQGFTLRSSGAAQFGVYRRRISASSGMGFHIDRVRDVPVSGEVSCLGTEAAATLCPVMRSMRQGQTSQA